MENSSHSAMFGYAQEDSGALLQQAQAEKAQLLKALSEMSTQMAGLQQEVQAKTHLAQSMQSVIAGKEQNITALQRTVNDLQEENKQFKTQIKEYQDRRAALTEMELLAHQRARELEHAAMDMIKNVKSQLGIHIDYASTGFADFKKSAEQVASDASAIIDNMKSSLSVINSRIGESADRLVALKQMPDELGQMPVDITFTPAAVQTEPSYTEAAIKETYEPKPTYTEQTAAYSAPVPPAPLQQPEQTTAAVTWTCRCGALNTGNFCRECAASKNAIQSQEPTPQPSVLQQPTMQQPVEPPVVIPVLQEQKTIPQIPAQPPAEYVAEPAAATGWACTCGALNTGNFCRECAAPRMQAAAPPQPLTQPQQPQAAPQPAQFSYGQQAEIPAAPQPPAQPTNWYDFKI